MQCIIPECSKETRQGRRICSSCEKARYKAKHPVKYAWMVFRNNARRRGKEFTITFEQFEKFCYETDLLHGRGRTSTSYHIDRIDDSKGYTIDNIQILTNAENVTKENKRRKVVRFDRQQQIGFMETLKIYQPLAGLPF